jgi:hypothetical protein
MRGLVDSEIKRYARRVLEASTDRARGTGLPELRALCSARLTPDDAQRIRALLNLVTVVVTFPDE